MSSIHACRALKRHLLALKDDKNVFDTVLKLLIIQSRLPIGIDINFEDSDDSLFVSKFCLFILFKTFI